MSLERFQKSTGVECEYNFGIVIKTLIFYIDFFNEKVKGILTLTNKF